MTRYQEILRNKKRIYHSQSSILGASLEFIKWLKEQPSGFTHRGNKFISTIKNGFMVRYIKNVSYNVSYTTTQQIMYDIIEMNGILLFINENHLSKSPIKPFHGTFKSTDKYEDVIKVHLREKKLSRLLNFLEED